MLITRSQQRRPEMPNAERLALLRKVSADSLRQHVERLAFPRSWNDRQANHRARDLLIDTLQGFGYSPTLQGTYDNIVVPCGPDTQEPCILLGAHYDSVPGTPGADDNASAVALCLECARLLQGNSRGRVLIVLFNQEEEGLLGSKEFVDGLATGPAGLVREAHIFEMVGYRSHAAGSQRLPGGLPLQGVPDVGDFLGLLANQQAHASAERVLSLAATYLRQTPVLALTVSSGVEHMFADLLRSDHAPFWEASIPALMWTDTSEFRNPHYHRASDTPETLDYDFLLAVTQLALAQAVAS